VWKKEFTDGVFDQENPFDTVLLESLSVRKGPIRRQRLSWYYAPSFLLLWLALFYAIVIPLYYKLPDRLTISDESLHPGEFVAERAQKQLFTYDRIGPKVTGSYANEVTTVEFLVNEVEKLRAEMRSDLYDLDVDVQSPTGGYVFIDMVNMYQGIHNVIVKLTSKSSPSESYLLLNSHFDSKPGSPGEWFHQFYNTILGTDRGIQVPVMMALWLWLCLRSFVKWRYRLRHSNIPLSFCSTGRRKIRFRVPMVLLHNTNGPPTASKII